MKKSIFLQILTVLSLLLIALVFASCDKDAHTHSFSTEWAKDGAYHWQACSGCEEIRNKSEHDWNAGIVTVPPTETNEGVRTYYCNSCGQTRIESIPVLDSHEHIFAETWGCDETHHWHAAICEHTTERKDYAPHAWDNGTVTVPPTTETEGTKTFTCLSCKRTKTEVIPPLNEEHTHAFVEKNTADDYLVCAATCLEKAKYFYSCACGMQGTETFENGEFANHKFTKYISDENATCTKDGTKTAKCDVCLVATDVLVDIGSAKGHAYAKEWSADELYHWHAAICAHTTEVSEREEHRWDEGVITKPATETTEGEKTYTCEVCAKTKVDTVGVIGHSHTYAEQYSSDDNYHWYNATCEHASEVKDKAAHKWDEGTVIYEANVYEDGVKLYVCLDCAHQKEEAIPKIPAFTVVFLDESNRMLSYVSYPLNTPVSEIELPQYRVKDGYLLKGWTHIEDGKTMEEINFAAAREGTVYQLKASVVKTYAVSFVDYAGKPLGETLRIEENSTLSLSGTVLPEIPVREGFTSLWNESILTAKITEDTVFSPEYTVITFRVTFLSAVGGKVLSVETVEYGSFALIPEAEPYQMNKKLYAFSGWKMEATGEYAEGITNGKVTSVCCDMTLYAAYENKIEAPVLAVQIHGTQMTVSLCMPEQSLLYSVRISVKWMEKQGIVDINSASVIQTSSLNAEHCSASGSNLHIEKEEWLTYNNKTKTFDFVWGCGSGHSFEIDLNLITLEFGSNDTAEVTKEIFTLLDDSGIVYGSADGTDVKESRLQIWFY